MKYRKKPVIIEAVQLLDNDDSIVECIEFVYNMGMKTSLFGLNATINKVRANKGFVITTLEGNMNVSFGDYIIKGVNGEFYPCKPDIFEKTYEPAE